MSSRSYRLGVQIVCGTVLVSAIVCSIWVLLNPPQVPARGPGSGSGRAAARRISVSGTIRPHSHADRSERSRLDRLVHIHPMSPVLSSDLGRDEGIAGTARQDERSTGQHLGRSRPRHAERSHRIRGQIRRIRRPLVVSDGTQAVDLRPRPESVQARARGNATRPTGHPTPKQSLTVTASPWWTMGGSPASLNRATRVRSTNWSLSARRLAQPSWVRGLPTVNASLNALCAVFLIAGWMAIRRRRAPLADPISPAGGESRRPATLLDQPAVRAHLRVHVAGIRHVVDFSGMLPGLSLPGGKYAIPPWRVQ